MNYGIASGDYGNDCAPISQEGSQTGGHFVFPQECTTNCNEHLRPWFLNCNDYFTFDSTGLQYEPPGPSNGIRWVDVLGDDYSTKILNYERKCSTSAVDGTISRPENIYATQNFAHCMDTNFDGKVDMKIFFQV